MFKRIIVVILCMTFWATSYKGHSQIHTSKSTSKDGVQISETVELALVIASLTSLDNKTNRSIRRNHDYYQNIETYFKDFKNHPIIEKLSPSFNLPRLVGNAADFVFDKQGNIVQIDKSGSLWDDDKNNLFANHLALIQDFATKSNFRKFYENQQETYQSYLEKTKKSVDQEDMISWLKNQFSTEAKAVKVFVSPLMSGFNWTTLYKPEQRIWVSAPSWEINDNPLRNLQYARVVFTELDHGYVNPLSTKHLTAINKAFLDHDKWGSKNAVNSYPSSELIFNEYMTWTAFLMYAKDKLQLNNFELIKLQTTKFMEQRRGFTKFEDFSEQALKLYTQQMKVKDIQIQMIEWASSQ